MIRQSWSKNIKGVNRNGTIQISSAKLFRSKMIKLHGRGQKISSIALTSSPLRSPPTT